MAVLAVFVALANPEGRVLFAASDLAVDAGVSLRTVKRVLGRLTRRGLIDYTPTWGGGARQIITLGPGAKEALRRARYSADVESASRRTFRTAVSAAVQFSPSEKVWSVLTASADPGSRRYTFAMADLVAAVNLSHPCVRGALFRLRERGLIDYTPRRGKGVRQTVTVKA